MVLTGAILAVEAVLAAALVQPRLAPLLLLAGLVLAALVLGRLPGLGVVAAAVLAVSILPASLVTVPIGPLEARGHELLVGGLVALALALPRTRDWGGAPAGYLAAFFAMLAVPTLLAVASGRTPASEAWAFGRALVPAAIFLALPRLFPDRRGMQRLLEAGVGVAAFTGAVAVLLALAPQVAELIPGGTDRIDSGGVYGEGANRIRLPGIALTYGLLLYAVVRLTQAPPTRRVLWALSIAAMIANLALSLNRNMWIGVILGFGLLMAFGGATLRRSLVVGGLVIALGAAALALSLGTERAAPGPVDTVIERGSTLLDPRAVAQEDSLEDRAQETDRAWDAVGGAPLTGIGPGTRFGVFFNEQRADGIYVRAPQLFLHNQYLYLLLITGLPGLLAFVGFLVASGRIGWRARGDMQVAALTAGLAMSAVSATVMITFASPSFSFVLGLMAAGIVVLARRPPEPAQPSAAR